jgi:hypothetical protein
MRFKSALICGEKISANLREKNQRQSAERSALICGKKPTPICGEKPAPIRGKKPTYPKKHTKKSPGVQLET